MGNILEEAAEILRARMAAVSVGEGDPLHGLITWKNNKLDPAELKIIGYIFGELVGDTFQGATFVKDGVTYYWGTMTNIHPPAKGTSRTDDINTYAIYGVGAVTTFDALTFIAEREPLVVTSTGLYPDLRIVGLGVDSFEALTKLAVRVFENMVTVTPYVVPAEITGFIVSKA